MWDEPLYLKMQLFLEVEADTSSGRTTMEFVYVAVVVFALLSRGQSAPASSCAALIQPLEIQRDQVNHSLSFKLSFSSTATILSFAISCN